MGSLKTGAVALAAIAVLALALTASAGAAGPWSGTGDGTTTVGNDGTSGSPASFTYSATGFSGSWQFSTSATAAGVVDLAYS